MNITTIVRTLTPLADAFEFYSIPYYLTGSLAISVYVKTQAVQGIEVVADIKFSQVPALVVQLEKTYDVKEIAIRAAIEQRGSFRLVHHDTLQKIDVALPAYRAYSQVKQEKAQRHTLDQGSRPFASLRLRIPSSCCWNTTKEVGNAPSVSGRPSWRFLQRKECCLISPTSDCGPPCWMSLPSSNKHWFQQASPMRSRLSTYFRHVVHTLSTGSLPKVKSHITRHGNVAHCFSLPFMKGVDYDLTTIGRRLQ